MAKLNEFIILPDGRKLGYAEYGDPKGKPIFYFHGWPGSRLRGNVNDKTAKKLKIRLISLDRPGYGISDYKEGRKLLDWADDVCKLADSLNIKKFSVVGVSGGGPYSAVCAYKIPHRIIKVGIVVGLAPTWIKKNLEGMSLTTRIGWANYSKYPILAFLGAYYHEMAAKYLPFLSYLNFRAKVDKEMMKNFSPKMREVAREAFRQGSKGARLDLFLYTRDWGFRLEDIKIPVYLWYGESDKNVGINMGKYYKEKIKRSKLVTYPNEGHLISIAHTDAIFGELIT